MVFRRLLLLLALGGIAAGGYVAVARPRTAPGAMAGAWTPPAWVVALMALAVAAAMVELAFRFQAPGPETRAPVALLAGVLALGALATAPAVAWRGPAPARGALAALGTVAYAALGTISAASVALEQRLQETMGARRGIRVDPRLAVTWGAGAGLAFRATAFAFAGGVVAQGLLAFPAAPGAGGLGAAPGGAGFLALAGAALPAEGGALAANPLLAAPGAVFLLYWGWQRRERLLAGLGRWAAPARLGPALLVAAALAAGALVGALPAWPAVARFLDRVLGAAPAAAALLGYPALFLGAHWLRRGRFAHGLAAVAVGTLAPAGTALPFLDPGAPLPVLALQALHAFWLGLLAGAIILALVGARRARRRAPVGR